jgi:hypothetical protein
MPGATHQGDLPSLSHAQNAKQPAISAKAAEECKSGHGGLYLSTLRSPEVEKLSTALPDLVLGGATRAERERARRPYKGRVIAPGRLFPSRLTLVACRPRQWRYGR